MPNGTHLELPSSVRAQLHAVARRLWWVETSVAVLGALAGVLAAYLVLFASDRVWETPAWLRLALAWAGVICAAAFAAVWVNRWVWQRRDARALATLVQRQYAKLGDRLLGIVELADDARRPPGVSPALCRAAMEQVAAESAELDFQRAVPIRSSRCWALAVAVIAGGVVAAVLWMPPAAGNVFWRLVKPMAPIERYTLTRLAELPAAQIVPYGEPFTVTFRLAESSRWRPSQARVAVEGQSPVTVTAGADGTFRAELPGQTKPATVRLVAGDAQQTMRVMPMYRPELVELQARIQWPDYLGYAAATQEVRSGKLRVLEGSELVVAGRLNRAARHVEGASFADDRFWIGPQPIRAAAQWAVAWEDGHGLRGRQPLRLEIQPEMDRAPVVDCRGLERTVAILEDEVVEFEVVARDDYGVKSSWLRWMAAGHEDTGVAPSHGRMEVADGGHQQRETTGKVRFSPQALDLAPQLVVVQAAALDYFPGREESLSPPYRIFILDRIEHAKLVQQRFEKLQEKLEELARLEEGLFDQNRQLREQLDQPDAAQRLAEALRAEQQNIAQMEKLAAEALELMREAVRNPTIREAVLREWAKLAEKLQKLAQQSLPRVSQQLQQARESPSGEQREREMEEALQAQQQALQQMRETLREMNLTQEQLAAGNFVSRLRKAARQERQIAADLTRLVPETIGLREDQLSPALKTKLGLLEDRQARNQKSVKYIRDDLGAFFSRTREKLYGAVHDDMVGQRVVEELEKLTRQIQANVGGQAIEQATRWAGQLEKWADQLAPPSGGGGGGGGGGGDQMSPALVELMLKLMRARLIEEGLRDNTRFLDERRDRLPEFAKAVARLEKTQRVLAGDIEKLPRPDFPPKLLELLGQVRDAMGDAADLLARAETGPDTIAAQTEVIELLSDASQEAAGGAAGSASLMALLQRMLGLAASRAGGGNPGGGDTDRPNNTTAGDPAGRPADQRPVEKATGYDPSRYPAEFREALENYFQRVEELAP